MADDPVAARLDEVREVVQRVHDLFAARPPRELNEDYGVGRLLGHAVALETVARLLAGAHKPVQMYALAEGCGHEPPGGATPGDCADPGSPLDAWYDGHPEGDSQAFICLETPLEVICEACTELVRSVTGSETVEVPAGECIIRPVLTGHLAREEASGGGS